MQIEEAKCFNRECLHLLGIKLMEGKGLVPQYFCEAFSNGIPEEIAYGNNLHKVPFEGQKNKIVFKKGDFK